MKAIRLTPRGTAAEAFLEARGRRLEASAANPRLPEALVSAVATYDLDDGLLYEVWELVRCAPALDGAGQAALAYLAGACLLAARRGSTRLPLEPGKLDGLLAAVGAGKADRLRARALLEAEPGARGGAEPLLGDADDFKPLVVDGGCLYLQRLREFERRLAGLLAARIAARPAALEGLERAYGEVIARPAGALRLSGEQERAVLAALHLPLAVITGGPGTGKTSIVVALLRVLARLGVPLESIALAAPTGKAAQRLEASIKKSLSSVEKPDEADRALLERCPAPRTLHRLLGYSPMTDRFRHHENNPLAEQVVIVDEGSMIDLFMMDRLVRAVDAGARLVLLGDAEQLPSVEAGAVFRDLVPERGAEAPRPWDGLVQAELPPPGEEAAGDLRAKVAVRLTRSFRQDEKDPLGKQILDFAARVNAGRAEEGLAAASLRPSARELEFRGVELVAAKDAAAREAVLDRWFAERVCGLEDLDALLGEVWRFEQGQPGAGQRERLERLLAHVDRSRVLCVTRGGGRPTGAEAINEALRRRWLARLGIPPGADLPRFAVGEPVMAERNDYERGLFNGDQGLVLRVRGEEGHAGARAVFARRDGWAAHGLEAEVGLARCYAMTVHKAQGSEYDAVLLVLPDEELPILTREILYTAVTRARRSVVILGDPELLKGAIGKPLVRWSGVGERLVAPVRKKRAKAAATAGG